MSLALLLGVAAALADTCLDQALLSDPWALRLWEQQGLSSEVMKLRLRHRHEELELLRGPDRCTPRPGEREEYAARRAAVWLQEGDAQWATHGADEAVAYWSRALDTAREAAPQASLGPHPAHLSLAWLAGYQEADAVAAHHAALAEQAGDTRGEATWIAAGVTQRRGRPGDACLLLEELASEPGPWRDHGRAGLALCAAQLGRDAQALALLDALEGPSPGLQDAANWLEEAVRSGVCPTPLDVTRPDPASLPWTWLPLSTPPDVGPPRWPEALVHLGRLEHQLLFAGEPADTLWRSEPTTVLGVVALREQHWRGLVLHGLDGVELALSGPGQQALHEELAARGPGPVLVAGRVLQHRKISKSGSARIAGHTLSVDGWTRLSLDEADLELRRRQVAEPLRERLDDWPQVAVGPHIVAPRGAATALGWPHLRIDAQVYGPPDAQPGRPVAVVEQAGRVVFLDSLTLGEQPLVGVAEGWQEGAWTWVLSPGQTLFPGPATAVLSWDGAAIRVPLEVSETAWRPPDAESVLVLSPWNGLGLQERLATAGLYGVRENKHGQLEGWVRPQDRAGLDALATREGLLVLALPDYQTALRAHRKLGRTEDRSDFGPLKGDAVRAALVAQPRWSHCLAHFTGSRSLKAVFSIGPAGEVVNLTTSNTGSTTFRKCLRPRLESVRFPATGGSSRVSVMVRTP